MCIGLSVMCVHLFVLCVCIGLSVMCVCWFVCDVCVLV